MIEDPRPTLELAVNLSGTRQHYTLRFGANQLGSGLCDNDTIPVTVMKPGRGENELPLCRRCASIARNRGLMPQEA